MILQDVQKGLIIVAGSLATLAGGYFLTQHILKKVKANNTEKGSLEQGTPANYAKRLRMAMFENDWFGWSEDEAEIFSIYTEIPTKSMVNKVHNAYYNLYNARIETHLQRSLNSAEFKKLTSIINNKPN
jgi:hypothetical protein